MEAEIRKTAEAIARGYTNVDSIKMFGGDTSRLAGDIMTTVPQVSDGIRKSTGIDPTALLAGALSGKKGADSEKDSAEKSGFKFSFKEGVPKVHMT